MDDYRILAIIPCYNEADTIEQVINEIRALSIHCDILVVDDGSKDGTYEYASKKAPCVRLIRNLGIGGAVQTGIIYAHRHDYDLCIQIDGDGQHPPSEVEKLVAKYINNSVNIIIGSRYLHEDTFRSTWARRLGSGIIAVVLTQLFRKGRVTDPTSGMRLLDKKTIDFFSSHYPHDFPEPISLAWALRRGLTFSEAAVEMRDRSAGRSSIFGIKPVTYMIRVLGYIILARFTKVAGKE